RGVVMRQYGEDIAAPVGNQPANRECQHDPNLLWSPSTRPFVRHRGNWVKIIEKRCFTLKKAIKFHSQVEIVGKSMAFSIAC
ncbi:hypothetical protein, partial [Thiolapillus sp.]